MKFVLNEKKRNTHKHELFELLLSFFAEFLIYHLAELANDFNLSFLSLLTAEHGEQSRSGFPYVNERLPFVDVYIKNHLLLPTRIYRIKMIKHTCCRT